MTAIVIYREMPNGRVRIFKINDPDEEMLSKINGEYVHEESDLDQDVLDFINSIPENNELEFDEPYAVNGELKVILTGVWM